MGFTIGHPEEWAYFSDHFEHGFEELARTLTTCHKLLSIAKTDDPAHRIIYSLAASCAKECEELMLLAGNGYGTGAMKLLRAFYERVITLSYLAEKPDKVQQFVDYSDIHWWKMLTEAREFHEHIALTPGEIANIEERYEASKERFTEEVCSKCGKKRVQMSWTKIGIPEQARQLGDELRMLGFNAYLRPTFYLHTTFYGLTMYAEKKFDGNVECFGPTLQREHAREALQNVHILMIHALDVTNRFFTLGEDDLIKDLANCWPGAWTLPSQ